jgi:hypothetical protein
MVKHLDKDKIEQAFRRAEKTLASGDKDARAGRFVARDAESGQFARNKDRTPRAKDSLK